MEPVLKRALQGRPALNLTGPTGLHAGHGRHGAPQRAPTVARAGMPTKSPQQDAARPDQGSDYEIVCGMVMGVLVGGDDGVGGGIHAKRDVRLITAPIEGEREVVGLCLLSTSSGPETAKVDEGNLVPPMQDLQIFGFVVWEWCVLEGKDLGQLP